MIVQRQQRQYAIYARTAAGGTAAVEAQVERCRAQLRADEPASVYRDVNVSGVGVPGPGLAALLADIESGEVNHVVVADWARLGRSPARIAQVQAIGERVGCRLVVAEAGG